MIDWVYMVYTFLLYGCIGWIIDSVYRSLKHRTWTPGGFSFLPFAPSYAVAAILLIDYLGPLFFDLSLLLQWFVFGLIFGFFEYICGHLSLIFVHRRLWDYSNGFMNIDGHTDLLHTVYWATLSIFVLHLFHPWIVSLI